MQPLTDKLYGIADGYYLDSEDYRLLHQILEEIEFLRKTNRLDAEGLGRLKDIIERNGGR